MRNQMLGIVTLLKRVKADLFRLGLQFFWDVASNTYLVADPAGIHLNKQPAAAKLKQHPGGKQQFSWRTRNMPTQVGNVSVNYKIVFDPAAKRVVPSGKIARYQNRVNGLGGCIQVDPREFQN